MYVCMYETVGDHCVKWGAQLKTYSGAVLENGPLSRLLLLLMMRYLCI